MSVSGRTVSVEGPNGKLSYDFRPEVDVSVDDDGKQVIVQTHQDDRQSRAYHGLTRALINNMVIGVKNGYEKKLELQGVGYVLQCLWQRIVIARRICQRSPQRNSARIRRQMPRQYAYRHQRMR